MRSIGSLLKGGKTIGPPGGNRLKAANLGPQVSVAWDPQVKLTLDPEPILHQKLEPRDLILIQSAAVSDDIPNFVELR